LHPRFRFCALLANVDSINSLIYFLSYNIEQVARKIRYTPSVDCLQTLSHSSAAKIYNFRDSRRNQQLTDHISHFTGYNFIISMLFY